MDTQTPEPPSSAQKDVGGCRSARSRISFPVPFPQGAQRPVCPQTCKSGLCCPHLCPSQQIVLRAAHSRRRASWLADQESHPGLKASVSTLAPFLTAFWKKCFLNVHPHTSVQAQTHGFHQPLWRSLFFGSYPQFPLRMLRPCWFH